MFPTRVLILISLLLWVLACMSHNVTIDDQYGDESNGRLVSYSPSSGAWSLGTMCDDCRLRPNASLAFNGTWHDSTYEGQASGPYSFTILFNGEIFRLRHVPLLMIR